MAVIYYAAMISHRGLIRILPRVIDSLLKAPFDSWISSVSKFGKLSENASM